GRLVADVDARVVIVSYNDEAWITRDALEEMVATRGAVRTFSFDSKRYVGAQIGIHDPCGNKVGAVSHLRNHEYLVVAGASADVERAAAAIAVSSRSSIVTAS